MDCFKLTKRNNEDLDKINKIFLWNVGSNESIGFPLVAWEEVCRPKCERYLGIRRNENVDKASIIKLGWTILTNDNFFRIFFLKKKEISLSERKLLIIENILELG